MLHRKIRQPVSHYHRNNRRYRDITTVRCFVQTSLDCIAGIALAIRVSGGISLTLKKRKAGNILQLAVLCCWQPYCQAHQTYDGFPPTHSNTNTSHAAAFNPFLPQPSHLAAGLATCCALARGSRRAFSTLHPAF